MFLSTLKRLGTEKLGLVALMLLKLPPEGNPLWKAALVLARAFWKLPLWEGSA